MISLTLNNFTHWSGGSLRIKGILTTLASKDNKMILISNIKDKNELGEHIIHEDMNISFSKYEKRLFQFVVALFPIFIVDIFFFKKLKNIKKMCIETNILNKNVISFEYLDNTFVYYLKKKSLIKSYINDLHGMATNEFKYKDNKNLFSKIYNKSRYYAAVKLDEKVFNNADGLIFATDSMKNYYLSLYNNLETKKSYIIPYVLQDTAFEQTIDNELLKELKLNYSIKNSDQIIFFAGGFKEIGGILDLVDAFILLSEDKPNTKLFILGKGYMQSLMEKKIKDANLGHRVILAGTIAYEQLRTFQELASVIVCPDRKNVYSDLIIHLKYYDSLLSGKVVINGGFKSVLEVNNNDKLSISFEPSNINDLSLKIIYALDNLERLSTKYEKNKLLQFFRYSKYHEEVLKIKGEDLC